MSNKNTAQTTGNKLNPLSTIKNLWDRYKSGKDKKQRQKNFESKLKLQQDKFDHKKEMDKDLNEYKNNKLAWDQEKTKNLYDQKERYNKQKIDIATANTQIKHNNSKVFQNDVQGKQALRNATITATERALKKDGYTGKLTRPEQPTKEKGPDKINQTIKQIQTDNKPVAWQGNVSGVNVKGSKGNREKGLPHK